MQSRMHRFLERGSAAFLRVTAVAWKIYKLIIWTTPKILIWLHNTTAKQRKLIELGLKTFYKHVLLVEARLPYPIATIILIISRCLMSRNITCFISIHSLYIAMKWSLFMLHTRELSRNWFLERIKMVYIKISFCVCVKIKVSP